MGSLLPRACQQQGPARTGGASKPDGYSRHMISILRPPERAMIITNTARTRRRPEHTVHTGLGLGVGGSSTARSTM